MHPVLLRLYQKALANQLAIAVGSSLSDAKYAIPSLAEAIKREFSVDFSVEHPLDYFRLWNEFVDAAEKIATRVKLGEFAVAYFADAKPTAAHEALALIPISNFVDTTFDCSLVKALTAAGRTPHVHGWMGQMMGGWKQTNPDNPTVFCMLPEPQLTPTFFGLHEPTRKHRIYIHLANLGEMLDERDLLLLEFPPEEAEWILNLDALATVGEKIIHYTQFFAAELIDITRKKQHDCFISYYSGDREFVDRLERDLTLRELFVWRDDREVDIGDSLSEKIQEGLKNSYCMIVVLSPEALQRPWVLEELRAAYSLRLAGELKILPVLHKECTLPPFLTDYRYVDFRDEQRYEESIALLERSIKNAVKRAREKK